MHNLMLATLTRAADGKSEDCLTWTLGGPGCCAMKSQGNAIILGNLEKRQCRSLAENTAGLDYPGVGGVNQTAKWFVERAVELGLQFEEVVPQRILALNESPRYPNNPGHARAVTSKDASRFSDWLSEIFEEALPNDPLPRRDLLERKAADGDYLFWVIDGNPVSMAGVVRRTRHAAAIGGVYTPPQNRSRGYAGSATAAVTDLIYAEGRTTACLYTDLRNPFSNRCYTKIGFKPVCDASFYTRALA